MKKALPLLLLAATAAVGASAAEALWLRDVKISPKGDRIAFTYKGDIYTVPVAGGTATRLTTVDSYEANPVWSPDGSKIAFSSDRNGNADVFVMDAAGGHATRLTSNSAAETPEAFSPDGTLVYFSAAIQNPAKSAMYPSSRMTEFYSVPVAGGTSRQVIGTPVQRPSFTPDGKSMLYQDVKGFEDEWRKHHTSSVTRDIWRYDFATGRHTNLTARPGEDRDPVVSPDGKTVFLLSERDGDTFNLWAFPMDNPNAARRLTDFTTHPVRFLSQSADGKLAMAYDGAIYVMDTPQAAPRRITVDIVTDDADGIKERIRVQPSGGKVSPDGEMIAFISRGDVFVTSVEYPSVKRVTDTPAAERHISWGADNRSLYYTSERSGRKNIYRAVMARKDDPNFPNATSIKEEPLFPEAVGKVTDQADEYSHPVVSPDGKKLAFVKNRNRLQVMDLASKKVTELDNGSLYPGQDDGMTFVWSPDSRWLALEMVPEMRDPYSDIALLEVATGKVTNITRSGYFCMNPVFALDGNALIFFTDRYGMRNHASWGSQEDIMIVFLNREARDRFMLGEEDFALLKDAEKKAKKADGDKKDDNAKGKKDKKKDKKETDSKEADKGVKPVEVELDGIEDRVMRLTPYSSNLSDAIVTADGETLYYLCAFEDGYDLWKLPLRKREPKLAQKINSQTGVSLQSDKDGKNIFLLGRKMQKLDPKSDKLKAIAVDATMDIDAAAEREAMFDYMTVEEAARFYNKGMHGVDWPAMTAAYRRFLPHIANNTDYAELLSELLGELNVSHTGGRYRGASPLGATDRTASFGLLYDMGYDGNGLKVAEIVANGPFDRAKSAMAPGAVITAVNGVELTPSADLGAVMNNIVGRKTLVAFTAPDGKKVEEVIRPVSAAAMSDLLYDRWVKQRAADVERWSGGRLGYVHVASMSDDSFRPMYADLLGKYANCDGVVIDIRWNGGGRMHEDIEVLFTGQKYLTQEIRGKDVCDMPSRRWNKPSIMLVAEPCYSNAHGTPWVYQHQKIGKVVGMPVPGTMTSVNWVTMQDPSLVFGIPVIGYRTADGAYLENTQLEPDIKVANAPETIVTGEDTQLRTAVETLLRDIDSRK